MKKLRFLAVALHLLVVISSLEGYKFLGPKWPEGTSVPFRMNYLGTPDCEGEFDAVERAFETWNAVSTSWVDFISLGTSYDVPDTGDYVNCIGWVESGWTSLPYYPSTLWPAYAIIDTLYSEINECDLFFNGQYFTWSAEPSDYCPYDEVDVEETAAHEAGHWVGLNDLYGAADAEKTMYGIAEYGSTKGRTLHSDDIAGASFLYPYEVAWSELVPCQSIADPYTLNVDVALSWNHTGRKEYCHFACQEGTQYEGVGDTVIPFDATVSPVRVRYWNNNTLGDWDFLSGYHERIYGPQLEINDNIVRA